MSARRGATGADPQTRTVPAMHTTNNAWADRIADLIAAAPPLTGQQADRLATLFHTSAARTRKAA